MDIQTSCKIVLKITHWNVYNSDSESSRDVSRKVLSPLVPVKEQKTSWKNNSSIFASLYTFAFVIRYNEGNSGVEPELRH